ncbi:MAG: tRNA pseudouridine(55) synthase TruB [Acidobacteria bacterium]|nr:tRNA pseudouridine(55) synthase TruB [Acidobacteriota bacterium]
MNGLLITDKPAGMTSHDVVNRIRRAFKTKKVGHTGTLDPFATGVLVLLIGKATRLAQFLDKDEKEYEAVVRLGYETETGDLTGSKRKKTFDRETASHQEIVSVLKNFAGHIEQIPPMFSAKKVDGKKLYEIARSGREIERKAVRVEIKEIELIDGEDTSKELSSFKMRVVCSSGTYIRTLAEDIGKELGTGAHLTELRRTCAGSFDLSMAHTLDDTETSADPGKLLLPMAAAVEHFPEIQLSEDRVLKTLNGMSTRVYDVVFADGENVRLLGPNGGLIAIGVFDATETSVRPKLVLG